MIELTRNTIDESWTLFLDRDGVINVRLVDNYVKSVPEFEFLPGVPQAIEKAGTRFGRIVVVTNQQGIGKGLYTENDLAAIHHHMINAIKNAGGNISAVYFAPQLKEENSLMRKPGIGMALAAREQFPAIDFHKSIMVGDSSSDMEFARSAGMIAVYCGEPSPAVRADYFVNSLPDFVEKFL